MDNIEPSELLFNSPLETGLRATIILNALYPKIFDLSTLTLLDYLVVHTDDINGPESLHPKLPQRTGEILVRRQIIEKGLAFMRRVGLVHALPQEEGFFYQATDEAYPFVNLLRTAYSNRLKRRAEWLVEFLSGLDQEAINNLMREKLEQWSAEFQEGNYFRSDNL